jgi:hypothetical protein
MNVVEKEWDQLDTIQQNTIKIMNESQAETISQTMFNWAKHCPTD